MFQPVRPRGSRRWRRLLLAGSSLGLMIASGCGVLQRLPFADRFSRNRAEHCEPCAAGSASFSPGTFTSGTEWHGHSSEGSGATLMEGGAISGGAMPEGYDPNLPIEWPKGGTPSGTVSPGGTNPPATSPNVPGAGRLPPSTRPANPAGSGSSSTSPPVRNVPPYRPEASTDTGPLDGRQPPTRPEAAKTPAEPPRSFPKNGGRVETVDKDKEDAARSSAKPAPKDPPITRKDPLNDFEPPPPATVDLGKSAKKAESKPAAKSAIPDVIPSLGPVVTILPSRPLVKPGDTVSFKITIDNDGDASLREVAVTATLTKELIPSMDPVKAGAVVREKENQVAFNAIQEIAAGGNRTVELTSKVAKVPKGSATVTVKVDFKQAGEARSVTEKLDINITE
jgi:uncharacterized repeat protein (TIGR01451 family)